MRIVIQVQVKEDDRYSYKAISEKTAEVQATDVAISYMPWNIICAGLVEATLNEAEAEMARRAIEDDKEES